MIPLLVRFTSRLFSTITVFLSSAIIMRYAALQLGLFALLCGVAVQTGRAEEPPEQVDFNRDIRPIFANFCTKCHGSDSKHRPSDFRLDQKTATFALLDSGGLAIVPGDSKASELFRRLSTADIEERMPPQEFGKSLSANQIELIRRWIDQGANWKKHWAYEKLQPVALPQVNNQAWPRGAIDHFLLAKMEQHQIKPQLQATKTTLLRRVTYDLTGLPPTPQEIAAFIADDSPLAFARVVDRLLASPRYGERMAVPWLDLARYADTHGYHMDAHRDMWRWRDWVIDALNRNQPFDEFTIEQLAGDLLPDATLEQKIASGFHRNSMINFEGGAIPEEYLAEYINDRVITTAMVWMGQSMQCARCHDHKFDPFTQRDFYQLYAFFNNVPEKGLDGDQGNAAPFIAAPTDLQQVEAKQLRQAIASLHRQLDVRRANSAGDQAKWEQRIVGDKSAKAQPPSDARLYFPFDEKQGNQANHRSPQDSEVKSNDQNPIGNISGSAIWLPGKFAGCLLFTGDTSVELTETASWKRTEPFTVASWVFPTSEGRMGIVSKLEEENKQRGFSLLLDDNKVVVRLISELEKNAIVVRSNTELETRVWRQITVSYDGSSKAAGLKVYLDGVVQNVETVHDSLTDSIENKNALIIGHSEAETPFRGMIDELRIFDRALTPTEAALLAGADPIGQILAIATSKRSQQQSRTLTDYYLAHFDQPHLQLSKQLAKTKQRQSVLKKSIPTTMVMQAMKKPRDTFIFAQGNYFSPTDKVTPNTPASLPPLPADAPRDRLGLARWLTSPNHPLTARVTVNRLWQTTFGQGLVRTPDDFGTRGQLPTHGELLDYLATRFIANGWDVKRLHREMLLSAAYQQSSTAPQQLIKQDPENLYWARASRQRLSAEMIRDTALFASGLIVERRGGKSVNPYQPPGLWKELSYDPKEFSAQIFLQSHGADLYRRSLYTFWKRSVPPPSLATFDAPNRETCTVSRDRTNTPLQALVLMNDPTYIEAARTLAERIMLEQSGSPERRPIRRIELAYQLVLSRNPSAAEVRLLVAAYQEELKAFTKDTKSAQQLLSIGESSRNEQLDIAEHAAWTMIANTVLNLDETITRN